MNATEKELILSDILKEIGLNPSLRGYIYIKEAILTLHENPKMMESITKELYPAIADKHDTEWRRVERCIRHAIEKCFVETAPEARTKYFGNCVNAHTGRVTSSTFIAVMLEAFNNEVKRGGMKNGSEA